MQIIAFDSHKRYTWALVETKDGHRLCEKRIEHRKGNIAEFLSNFQTGSPVALETIGTWYWIVDEIEKAGMVPSGSATGHALRITDNLLTIVDGVS